VCGTAGSQQWFSPGGNRERRRGRVMSALVFPRRGSGASYAAPCRMADHEGIEPCDETMPEKLPECGWGRDGGARLGSGFMTSILRARVEARRSARVGLGV